MEAMVQTDYGFSITINASTNSGPETSMGTPASTLVATLVATPAPETSTTPSPPPETSGTASTLMASTAPDRRGRLDWKVALSSTSLFLIKFLHAGFHKVTLPYAAHVVP